MPLEKDIPFIKGRRVGQDSILSRDEQWGARVREAATPRDEWFISTMPMHGHNGLVVNDELDQDLNIVPLPTLSSTLDAVAVRLKIFTAHSGKHIRTCLYQYDSHADLRFRKFRKVLHSDAVIDLSTRFTSAPKDVALKDVAELHPNKRYFLGYLNNSDTARLPTNDTLAAGLTVGHYPVYTMAHADQALPKTIRFSKLAKYYGGNVPWITYISNDALQLF